MKAKLRIFHVAHTPKHTHTHIHTHTHTHTQHPSLAIVKAAGLIMKAIIEVINIKLS